LTELSENEDVLELAKDIIVTEIGNITETMFPAPEDPAAEDNNKVYRDVINEVVTQVIGHEYGEDEDIKNEIGVVTSALEVAQKLTDKDDEQEVTAEDIDKVIEALDNSTVLLGVLTATSTEPGHEGEQTSAITQEIQNQISKQDEAVQDQIEAWLLAATEGKENAAALYAIFFGNND